MRQSNRLFFHRLSGAGSNAPAFGGLPRGRAATTGVYPASIAVSADGKVLVGTSHEPNSVCEFDPTTSTPVSGFGTPA